MKERRKGLLWEMALILLTVAACLYSTGAGNIFGAKVDWSSQHIIVDPGVHIPPHSRNQKDNTEYQYRYSEFNNLFANLYHTLFLFSFLFFLL